MAIFGLTEVFEHLKGDMARARTARKQLPDEQLVATHFDRLVAAGIDRPSFDRAFEALKADKRLKSVDLIAIAHEYGLGGKKPSSKTMALAAISKRFVEIVRFHAKNKVAEKARPW
jgi:hypothetical protein